MILSNKNKAFEPWISVKENHRSTRKTVLHFAFDYEVGLLLRRIRRGFASFFSHEHNLIEHSYNILTLSNNTVGKISLFTLLLHLTGSGSRKILQKQFCFMSKKNSARHLGLQFNLTPIFVRSKRHLSIHLPN